MRYLILLLVCFNLSYTGYAQLTIKAVGDIMLGSQTPHPNMPRDSGSVFVRSLKGQFDSADFVFGNLEGVFVNGDVKPQKCSSASRKAGKCYEFGMPERLAPALKHLKFNILSMDNNHNSDYGYAGVKNTKRVLDKQGINYASKKAPIILEKNGVKYGFIAFGHSSISYHVADLKNTKNVITALDEKCDVIIVSFHGGAEGTSAQHVKNESEMFYGENRGNLIQFTHTAIDAGADLIIGHGPHVLRAMEIYKDRLIMYSLGNFLTHGNVSLTGVKGLGAIVEMKIDEKTGAFISGNINPTAQRKPGIPYVDSEKAAIKVIKDLTAADFPEGTLVINANGSLVNPNYKPDSIANLVSQEEAKRLVIELKKREEKKREEKLLSDVGFEKSVFRIIRKLTQEPIEQLYRYADKNENDKANKEYKLYNGITLDIHTNKVKYLITGLRKNINNGNYVIYEAVNFKHTSSKRVVVLKTTDQFDILDIECTKGKNVTTERLETMLRAWDSKHPFTITVADKHSLTLVFDEKPHKAKNIAKDALTLFSNPDSSYKTVAKGIEKSGRLVLRW